MPIPFVRKKVVPKLKLKNNDLHAVCLLKMRTNEQQVAVQEHTFKTVLQIHVYLLPFGKPQKEIAFIQ